jgi:hypothetical protein
MTEGGSRWRAHGEFFRAKDAKIAKERRKLYLLCGLSVLCAKIRSTSPKDARWGSWVSARRGILQRSDRRISLAKAQRRKEEHWQFATWREAPFISFAGVGCG